MEIVNHAKIAIIIFLEALMENLAPEHFFDLTSFAHASIFQGCTFVWQALEKIDEYLKSKTLGKFSQLIKNMHILLILRR